jgi:transcriptional regulator GlxA family with amidase domain
VAVVAFDGVVLGDLATPLEVFALARNAEGRPCYEVRTCSQQPQIESGHLTLQVPWRLSSLKRADTVIVPGIDNLDRPISEELLRANFRAISGKFSRSHSITASPLGFWIGVDRFLSQHDV